MTLNIIRAFEAAVAFAIVEGFELAIQHDPIGGLPLAFGIGALFYHTGANIDNLKQLLADLKLGGVSQSQPSNTPQQTNTQQTANKNNISYNYQGQKINYDLAGPLGLDDGRGNTYSVGEINQNDFVSALGETIPKGAVYLGAGSWGFNGNYLQAN